MTRGRKILLGCLVFMAAVVVAIVVVVFSAFAWLARPGASLETHRLVDTDTVLLADVTLPRESEAAREFIRALIASQQDGSRDWTDASDLPAPLTMILQRLPDQGVTDADIDEVLPITLAASQQGPGSMPRAPLFILNFPNAGNALRFIDWTLSIAARRDDETRVVDYRDEAYILFPDASFWVSIIGTDLAIALDEAAMRSGIDRLQRPMMDSPDPTPLTPVLAAAPDDAVLRVATTAGAAVAVAEALRNSAPLVAGILDATAGGSGNSLIWARLESVDRLVGEILADSTGEDAGAERRFTLEAGGLQFRVEPAPPTRPWRSRWRFEIDGVQNLLPLLTGWLAAMDDGVPALLE